MSASSDIDPAIRLGDDLGEAHPVGNVVQAIFSNKLDAKLFYDDVESTFKSEQDRLRFAWKAFDCRSERKETGRD